MQYDAEAIQFVPAHTFPKSHCAKQTCAALKFLCKSDVFDDAAHAGFIIPVVEWNRYRHYTYQNDREAEKVYIKSVGATGATGATEAVR